MTPEQFAGSYTVDGVDPEVLAASAADAGLDALSGALGGDDVSQDDAGLGEGGDNPLDIALGGALDGAAQQGGAPAAGGAAGAGSGAAGADIAADEVEDEETDQAQVDDGGGG